MLSSKFQKVLIHWKLYYSDMDQMINWFVKIMPVRLQLNASTLTAACEQHNRNEVASLNNNFALFPAPFWSWFCFHRVHRILKETGK